MKKQNHDPLEQLRSALERHVRENYNTVEEFCWEKDLNKATVSNFLRDKKDFRVSTLVQLADAMNRTLVIKFD